MERSVRGRRGAGSEMRSQCSHGVVGRVEHRRRRAEPAERLGGASVAGAEQLEGAQQLGVRRLQPGDPAGIDLQPGREAAYPCGAAGLQQLLRGAHHLQLAPTPGGVEVAASVEVAGGESEVGGGRDGHQAVAGLIPRPEEERPLATVRSVLGKRPVVLQVGPLDHREHQQARAKPLQQVDARVQLGDVAVVARAVVAADQDRHRARFADRLRGGRRREEAGRGGVHAASTSGAGRRSESTAAIVARTARPAAAQSVAGRTPGRGSATTILSGTTARLARRWATSGDGAR